MSKRTLSTFTFVPALCAALAGADAAAQGQVSVYGRVDLSVAQQPDAAENTELRNGSASRLGFKGEEDLGGGLKVLFHLEHRFNADSGTQSGARMWEGKSIVGLKGAWGRVTLGRDENPAFSLSQWVSDPWGGDTVASNGSIVNGRIGSTRYSNSVNWRGSFGGFTAGLQTAERDDNLPSGGVLDDRPWSVGMAWASGPLTLGLGHENPADADDHWSTVNAAWDFGPVKLGAMAGSGRNVLGQKHRSVLVTAVAPLPHGELRGSWGELKNTTLASGGVLDRQLAVGYFHPLSKRTTVYANLVHEGRDNLPDGWRSTGYDLGLRHNF